MDDEVGVGLVTKDLIAPLTRRVPHLGGIVEHGLPHRVVGDLMDDQDVRHGGEVCSIDVRAAALRNPAAAVHASPASVTALLETAPSVGPEVDEVRPRVVQHRCQRLCR